MNPAVACFAQLRTWCLDFGAPRILHCDNGSEFGGEVVAMLARQFPGTQMVHGRPRHPQTQGLVERGNRSVKEVLAKKLQDLVDEGAH